MRQNNIEPGVYVCLVRKPIAYMPDIVIVLSTVCGYVRILFPDGTVKLRMTGLFRMTYGNITYDHNWQRYLQRHA